MSVVLWVVRSFSVIFLVSFIKPIFLLDDMFVVSSSFDVSIDCVIWSKLVEDSKLNVALWIVESLTVICVVLFNGPLAVFEVESVV